MRSAVIVSPPSKCRRTPGSTPAGFTPSRSTTPSSSSTSAISFPASGWSRGSSRSATSTSVTCEPIRQNACASSQPTGPAPITISLPGTSCVVVASRFVQCSTSARPGIGGIVGTEPVATRIRPKLIVRPSTSTRPGPAIRAVPRTSSTSRSASHWAWLESSPPPVTWSRCQNARATSIAPVTASAAPGTSRAAAIASGGRSSALDGMQAK